MSHQSHFSYAADAAREIRKRQRAIAVFHDGTYYRLMAARKLRTNEDSAAFTRWLENAPEQCLGVFDDRVKAKWLEAAKIEAEKVAEAA